MHGQTAEAKTLAKTYFLPRAFASENVTDTGNTQDTMGYTVKYPHIDGYFVVSFQYFNGTGSAKYGKLATKHTWIRTRIFYSVYSD